MATFGIRVFKHHEKKDGTFNVKIRITQERRSTYIDTSHFVTAKMLSKNYAVKDTFILKDLYGTLSDYREAVSRLGSKVNYMDADDIKSFLEKRSEKIDFLAFCQQHIDLLVANDRSKTATGFRTVRYALIDFLGNKHLPAEEITPNLLMSFERFLRSPRQIKRINRFDKEVIIQSKGSTDAGVHNYMHDLRTLFNAARKYYNRPSLGIVPIQFSPFSEYQLPELTEIRKRNLTAEQLRGFIQFEPPESGRIRVAYDLFLLSFYMCGMNAVDFYNCGFEINDGGLEYERSKTKEKRKDRAFISIKVPEPAVPLIEKYKNHLTKMYSEIGNLNKALNNGLKVIGSTIGVPDLSFYWGRHTFGNLARNKCRKSKDDVALALNHVDHGRRTTDIYLEKDWTIVDEVQEAVIAFVMNGESPRPKNTNKQPNVLSKNLSEKLTIVNSEEQRKTMKLVGH
ncbi:MAG: recombinase [Mucilaginibacter sp.]|nr:recombinase [Mucilaginibacter sp.]